VGSGSGEWFLEGSSSPGASGASAVTSQGTVSALVDLGAGARATGEGSPALALAASGSTDGIAQPNLRPREETGRN
jgi:hypothetical protein